MAKKALHAFDYLARPEKHLPRAVCVLFGDELFLRRQALGVIRGAVLGGDEGDFSLSTFEGRTAELADVLEELATVAMFGPGKRLAVVDGADEFVSRYRGELEDYLARPADGGVLVLDLKSFPSNTRLYKAVAAEGLAIDCNCPTAARVTRWLGAWAKQVYQVQLPQTAAEMLVETIGLELGLLDQELAKLALLSDTEGKITAEMVGRLVGGWRARTTWEMLDAALAGELRGAMTQLDRLLLAGESPVGLLGQISASLRRLAAATRLVCQTEAAGRRITLRAALERAGIRSFVLRKAEQQLRHLGRVRGGQLYRWLLQADLDLKGASAIPPRLILERLIIRLALPGQVAAGGR
ncbi:MAG: DNA polymerase III subunit delta [Planctomycetota bacterium]|jgi:DNA polymerase-3 subunit delta